MVRVSNAENWDQSYFNWKFVQRFVNVNAVDRYLLDRSAHERFGIGAVLAIVGSSIAQANLGPMTRLAAVCGLLGVAFLAMSLEPPLTGALGGEDWTDLSTGKQMILLSVLSLVGLVLWFAVTTGAGAVADAI